MSESEEDHNRSDESENEDEEEAAENNPKNDGLPPFTFEESIAKIRKLGADLEAAGNRPKKLKVKWKWVQVLPSLRDKAGTEGFSLEDLRLLWKIATSPSVPGSVSDRGNLLMAMVPTEQLDVGFVKDMCYWLSSSVKDPSRRWSVFYKKILNYLYGITEYSLVPAEEIWTAVMYSRMFLMNQHTQLVVPLFSLLKKVTTKTNFSPYHTQMALRLKDNVLKPDQRAAVVNLLKKYQVLHPEYFATDTSRFLVGRQSTAKILSDDFKFRLFQAKRRSVGAGAAEDIADEDMGAEGIQNANLYPEFAVDYEDYPLETVLTGTNVNKRSAMMWAVMKPKYVLFNLDPVLRDLLETWVGLNLKHKISRVLIPDHRAKFFLDKVVGITIQLQEGLQAVDEWLLDYMITWDYTLYKDKILDLFSYLSVFDVSDLRSSFVFRMMESQFLCGAVKDSYLLWLTMEQLLLNWTKSLRKMREGLPENQDEYNEHAKAAKGLFDIMKKWLSKFIAIFISDQAVSGAMLQRMTLTFTKLAQEFNEGTLPFEPVPPSALAQAVILTDFGPLFEHFAEFMLKTENWKRVLNGEELETYTKIEREMLRFFECGDDQLPMVELFHGELEQGHNAGAEAQVALIESALKNLTCESSETFKTFRTLGDGQARATLDLPEMKRVLPNLTKYYQKAQKKERRAFVPPFSSTPLHPRANNQGSS